MPEPLRYLQAISAALIGSGMVILVFGRRDASARRFPAGLVNLFGLAAGILGGLVVLQTRLSFPPASGLDRFFLVLVPAAFAVEFIRALGARRWLNAPFMMLAALGGTRVLLHDSVYLASDSGGPFGIDASLFLELVFWSCWLGVAGQGAQHRLEQSNDPAPCLALALAIQTAGLLVMLAGYLKGGAVSFPLSAAVVASGLVASWMSGVADLRGVSWIATWSLFGVLFVGRFFGALTPGTAAAVMIAPFGVWIADLPGLRRLPRWPRLAVQLFAVAIPLVILLARAKLEFDRKMGPLL